MSTLTDEQCTLNKITKKHNCQKTQYAKTVVSAAVVKHELDLKQSTEKVELDEETDPVDLKYIKYDMTQLDRLKMADCFQNTRQITHCGILKPYSQKELRAKKAYFVGYKDFDCVLSDWTIVEQPMSADDADLHPWWKRVIKTLLEAICQIHKEGYIHGGLRSDHNYVVHGNLIKIINVGVSRKKFPDKKAFAKACHADLSAFKDMLERKFKYTSDDKQEFFELLNSSIDYKFKMERLIRHPFFMSGKQLFQYLWEIQQGLESKTLLQFDTFNIKVLQDSAKEFRKYNGWTTRIKDTDSFLQQKFSERDYADSPEGLLRFLRNLGEHRGTKTYEELDAEIKKHYGGFVSKVHKYTSINPHPP